MSMSIIDSQEPTYREEHEIDVLTKRIAELKANDGTRWHELFGTPERAAEYFALRCLGSDGEVCSGCPFELACDATAMRLGSLANIKVRMLEWLRGDA